MQRNMKHALQAARDRKPPGSNAEGTVTLASTAASAVPAQLGSGQAGPSASNEPTRTEVGLEPLVNGPTKAHNAEGALPFNSKHAVSFARLQISAESPYIHSAIIT